MGVCQGEIKSEETVKEFRKFRDVMGLGFDRTHKKREIKERIKEQKNDSTRL